MMPVIKNGAGMRITEVGEYYGQSCNKKHRFEKGPKITNLETTIAGCSFSENQGEEYAAHDLQGFPWRGIHGRHELLFPLTTGWFRVRVDDERYAYPTLSVPTGQSGRALFIQIFGDGVQAAGTPAGSVISIDNRNR